MTRSLPLFVMSCLALCVAQAVQAADVDVYGIVDVGMHYTDSKYGDSSTTMDSGISKGSRIGLRGSENLGNGYAVVFNLETGFTLDDGAFDNTKNRLFNRNAYLGMESPYGEVRFGRQGALGSGVNGSIFLNSYTVFGNLYKEAQALQVINHQVMRADNMIRYESPDFAGLKLYGEYSNGVDGDDAVPSSKRDRFGAVGMTYRTGPLRLVFVADNYFYKDDAYYKRDDSQTYNFGIRYDLIDDVTLYGAYQYGANVEKVGNQMKRYTHKDTAKTRYGNEGFDSHAVVLGTKIDAFGGKVKVQTGYATGDNDYFKTAVNSGKRTNGRIEADVWQFAVGYDYPLSKRTYLYAAASYVDRTYKDNGVEVKGDKETDTVKSAMVGICHSF